MSALPSASYVAPRYESLVPIAALKPSMTEAQQMRRKGFNKEHLVELAESIKQHGVLSPLVVRPLDGGRYEIVAGERRCVAAGKAGLESVPVLVRELTDEQVIEVQLIENLQREDIHPLQEAEGYEELIKKHGHSVEDLHTKIGKSRGYVYGRMKLLALCKQARTAFYAGEISASIALLLARIPDDKLQREALKTVTEQELSYRSAAKYVQEDFMLRLVDAPFPTDDAALVVAAGPCGACPKRTGNAPDLFDDIKSADVCTDPVCYRSKIAANATRLLEQAKADGKKVLGIGETKALTYGGDGTALTDGSLRGYFRLSDRYYVSGSQSESVRKIVGKEAETVIAQDQGTGELVELVSSDVVEAAARKHRKATTGSVAPQDDGTRARKKKQRSEKAFRAALYERVRPLLDKPQIVDLAKAIWRGLDHDTVKIIAELQGWEPIKGKYDQLEYRALESRIGEPGHKLTAFLNDCLYADQLNVPTWSDTKPERLLAAAKSVRVDPAKVRREVETKGKTPRRAKKKPKTKARARPRGKAKAKSKKRGAR